MFLILITNKQVSWVGKRASGKSHGTWVRIPGPPNIFVLFFSRQLHVVSASVDYHGPSDLKCQMAFRPNPKARIEGSPYIQVNKRIWNQQSQSRLERKWALNMLSYLLIWGPNPPLVHFLLLLIIFIYLFYCLN